MKTWGRSTAEGVGTWDGAKARVARNGPGAHRANGLAKRDALSAALNSWGRGRTKPKRRAERAVQPWPPIGLFDVMPGMVDEVHVMDARGAGRHARQAGRAAVDVLDDVLRRRAIVLQHILDEIDPPSGAVEFVAKQRIGRTGRGAEAAMDAGPKNLLGLTEPEFASWAAQKFVCMMITDPRASGQGSGRRAGRSRFSPAC